MVAGFRRSTSLSGPSPSSPGRVQEKSYRVRSASLPCRSHPIISQVEDGIRALHAWQSEAGSGSSSSLSDGLDLLSLLHNSLKVLLRLPRSQDSIRRGSAWTDGLLDDFLRLADAHGTFRSSVMALKQHQSEAQVALRRRDEAGLTSCVKSQRRTEKELVKLASALRHVFKPLPCTSDAAEAELVGILREVTLVTVSASASIFLGISTAASSTTTAVVASSSLSNNSWIKRLSSSSPKKKSENEEETEARRTSALQCLEGLEECLGSLESRSEQVFRTLVNARVALLNVLTL